MAEEASSYPSIVTATYKGHKIEHNVSAVLPDKQTKVIYDVLTLDKNSIEIKRNFINSYIFSFLFTEPNSTVEQIFDFINPHLNNTLDQHFLEKELQYLRSKKQLISPSDNKKVFQLSDEKASEINAVFSAVLAQEQELEGKIVEFIKTHKIKCTPENLIECLYKLYQDNYTIDIEEIKNTNNSFNASIRRSFNDLMAFFTKKGETSQNAKQFAKELLSLCDNNDLLNKLSSIQLFNNLYSSNKLEKYINDKVQEIVLDTQILIRIICVLYKENIDFKDPALQSVKILLSTFEIYRNKIRLLSTHDYVSEVTNHLKEAIKLQRFLNLPFISKLGNSKNVFYNFYLDLKREDLIDVEMNFTDFIEALLGMCNLP